MLYALRNCTLGSFISPYACTVVLTFLNTVLLYKQPGWDSMPVWLNHDYGILKSIACRTNVCGEAEVMLYYSLIIIRVGEETQRHRTAINKNRYLANLPANT